MKIVLIIFCLMLQSTPKFGIGISIEYFKKKDFGFFLERGIYEGEKDFNHLRFGVFLYKILAKNYGFILKISFLNPNLNRIIFPYFSLEGIYKIDLGEIRFGLYYSKANSFIPGIKFSISLTSLSLNNWKFLGQIYSIEP